MPRIQIWGFDELTIAEMVQRLESVQVPSYPVSLGPGRVPRTTQTENEVEKFWDFSVSTYYGEGVQEAFLDLQNERSADINLLLFCIWLGKTHCVYSDELFSSACEFSELWAGNVVVPLRNVRTWMKLTGCPDTGVPGDDCMSLRDKVKGVEFGAEKLQEEMLESLCSELPGTDAGAREQISDAVSNIRRYFAYRGIEADDWVDDRLRTILLAAMPKCTRDDIKRAVGA
jgi:uncharacterized protein (TIGR02444 family)